MKFQIRNRWTGEVQYECELTAEIAGQSYSLQLGWAVKKAVSESANLGSANLGGANLGGANLGGANLGGANLGGADLRSANLGGANLRPIRDDVWAVLSSAPAEVAALREALVAGRVDGSTYSGECACLVGTLAHARGTDEHGIPGLSPTPSRPAERFFMAIRRGDTPETNEASAIALGWVDEWLANVRGAFAAAA